MLPSKTLPASAMHNTADYERQAFHVVVEDHVTLEDIVRPAFWAHHAAKVKKLALIDVVRADMTLDVQLRVIDVGVGYIKVRPLRIYEDKQAVKERKAAQDAGQDADEAAAAIKLPEEYKITATGKGGFTVTYLPNDAKIATGKRTRLEAIAVVKDHAEKAGIAWPEATPAENNAGT